MSLSKQIKDSMVESINDKIADIADLVGEKGEIITDRMKTLGFSEYVELMKAVKNTDEETARDILGLGLEEGTMVGGVVKYDGQSEEEYAKAIKLYNEFMSKPRPANEETSDMIMSFIFDDELLDDMYDAQKAGDADVRPMVLKRMSELGLNEANEELLDLPETGDTTTSNASQEVEEVEKQIAADIKDYVDDHKKHFDAYPMDVEVDDKVYSYDEYWKMLDKYYPVKYGIIRYPDTAISYIKNDGNGWEHIYDKSYGFKGPVDKKDMQHASKIEKEKIPSRMFKEEYSSGGTVGTMSPGEQRAAQAQQAQQAGNPLADRNKKTQALQRLGRKNLGGATAQQAADAIDKAQQGEPLTPIQRKAMAHQSQNLDALASNPKTAMQFRNLLNKLNQG